MFCSGFRKKLKAVIAQVDAYVLENADTALKVTTALRAQLAGTVGNIITALIPGTADDAARVVIISALDKSISALSVVNACAHKGEPTDKLRCFVDELNRVDPKLREAMLMKLQSLLTKHLDGRGLPTNIYDLAAQVTFSAAKLAK